MIFWMFLKIFGDVCLYFSVIGAFPTLFSCGFSFLWPALLCGAGAGTAAMLDDRGQRELRFLGLILPACSLFLTQSVFDAFVMLPVILYTAVMIFRGEFSLEYYSFRDYYIKSLMVWGASFGLLFVIHQFELMTIPDRAVLASDKALSFGLLYAASGILLLRQLRLGEENQVHGRAANRRQMVAVAAGTGVTLLGVVALERMLHEQATSIENLLGRFLEYLVSLPLMLIGWIIELFLTIEPERVEETIATEPTVETEAAGLAPLPSAGLAEPVQDAAEPGFPWWLVVLILGALTVTLIFMLRILRTHSSVVGEGEQVKKVTPARREKRESDRTNRGKVRRYYREFLKSEKRRGMKLRKDHTSEDILRSISAETDPEAAAELRQIYLAARYDHKREVSVQEVRQAKNALKKINET